jgi:cation diffusion facilitator family transporter
MRDRRRLTRYAWLSIATAVFTIGLKAAAYFLTNSVGLLSDALESGVNLITAVLALIVLSIAAQPPDEEHAYGHTKAEYFAAGAEGMLILFAAVTIGVTAGQRLLNPQPLEQIGLGLLIAVVAAACNGLTARILLQAGREHDSPTLTGEGKHLMTDVWTTGGVLFGVGAVVITGWGWLDPLIAVVVAGQVVVSGLRLLRQAVDGLMDRALPPAEMAQIVAVLDAHKGAQVQYHALRTRKSGSRRFITVHVQVPGAWSVQRGHELLEEIERDLRQTLPSVSVFTHLEPIEDPVSWQDIPLLREDD